MVSLAVAAALALAPSGHVAFVHGGRLVELDLATGKQQIVALHATRPVAWSGDGKLLSYAGHVVGGPTLPTARLVWAPSGETAAYITKRGGVVTWTPGGIRRVVVRDGWGAQALAWRGDGSLALGRAVCYGACGRPIHKEVWVWHAGSLRRVVGPLRGDQTPMPFAWSRGRVLWWDYPDSASIAADGVAVYSNDRKIATALMYADYVAVCSSHVAIAAGGDRYATHGKRILFDGRDVSHDKSRSWVSPSCGANGTVLVAAAGRNWEEDRFGHEHRAIWELLPTRRRLTQPPSRWTDENPHVLADGSILFVRTRQTSRKSNGKWFTTTHATLELLSGGRLRPITDATSTASETSGEFHNYYGHYDWPDVIAVAP